MKITVTETLEVGSKKMTRVVELERHPEGDEGYDVRGLARDLHARLDEVKFEHPHPLKP